jgi:hypothetical protein
MALISPSMPLVQGRNDGIGTNGILSKCDKSNTSPKAKMANLRGYKLSDDSLSWNVCSSQDTRFQHKDAIRDQDKIQGELTAYCSITAAPVPVMIEVKSSISEEVQMADIEILRVGTHEYLSFEDTGRYLGCTTEQARDYVYLGKLRAEQVGSRWLIDWESVKEFAKQRGQRRRVG